MWHVTVATVGRRTWFPERPQLEHAVRALARIGGERLLLFAVGDDHAHWVLRGDRAAVAQRSGDIVRSLRSVPRFEAVQPCYFKRWPAENTSRR